MPSRPGTEAERKMSGLNMHTHLKMLVEEATEVLYLTQPAGPTDEDLTHRLILSQGQGNACSGSRAGKQL